MAYPNRAWRGRRIPRCRPHPSAMYPVPRDGRRNCGHLERILVRQWPDGAPAPSPALVQAIDRLADLPAHIAGRLADELDSSGSARDRSRNWTA